MPNRKWSAQEEQELLEAYKQGASVEALAQKYRRSPEAIKMKLKRLGLDVVAAKLDITGQLNIPNELPSLEEVLKIVAAAIMKACEPGLGKTELQRLDVIATLYKAYAAGLEQYVGYKKIEAKLLELEKKYAVLAEKAKGSQAQSNSA
jgi:transposase-like protein